MLECVWLYAVHQHIVGSMEIEALFDFGVWREQYVKPGYADEIQVQYKAHGVASLRVDGGTQERRALSENESYARAQSRGLQTIYWIDPLPTLSITYRHGPTN